MKFEQKYDYKKIVKSYRKLGRCSAVEKEMGCSGGTVCRALKQMGGPFRTVVAKKEGSASYKGRKAELFAASVLKNYGEVVDMCGEGKYHCKYDLLLNNKRIDVKSSHRTIDGKWNFGIHSTNFNFVDFIFAVGYEGGKPLTAYFIPSGKVPSKARQLQIPISGRTKYSVYKLFTR